MFGVGGFKMNIVEILGVCFFAALIIAILVFLYKVIKKIARIVFYMAMIMICLLPLAFVITLTMVAPWYVYVPACVLVFFLYVKCFQIRKRKSRANYNTVQGKW